MKKGIQIAAVTLALSLCMPMVGCSKKEEATKVKLDPDNPVTIRVLNYYQGAQQDSFNKLVKEFNKSVGSKDGIIVETSSVATVEDVEESVENSVNQKVGSGDVPDIFSAYADTSYKLSKKKKLVDLSKYLTKDEQNQFVKGYLSEGQIKGGDSIQLFPIAKAVEILELNETDWDAFAKATGAKKSSLETMEGITKVAKQYYEWTDAKTPNVANDGKAFFNRDAFSNFMIISAKQLGCDIFQQGDDGKLTLNFDKKVIKKIWDNYYVPYISGYFKSVNRFSSDDMKMGEVVSFVGSSSGVTFVADEKVVSDTKSVPITVNTYKAPSFEGEENYAIQQGAGMAVLKSSKKKEYASVEFLKWFTKKERNTQFSLDSGYLPVLKSANNKTYLKKAIKTNHVNQKVAEVIDASMDTVKNCKLYSPSVNEHATNARTILSTTMPDLAKENRKKVEKLLSSGTSIEKAVATYNTDKIFDAWYQDTKKQLEKNF